MKEGEAELMIKSMQVYPPYHQEKGYFNVRVKI